MSGILIRCPEETPRGPWREVFAITREGEMVPVNGPALAFGGISESGWPFLIYYDGPRGGGRDPELWQYGRCVSQKYGCSNGRAVDENGRYR